MSNNITYQLSNLDGLAKALLESFDSKIILFTGQMGSGKTTLIKALLEVMGSTDEAHSPSFSLVNDYHTDKGVVHHFDLFRIEDPEEIWDFGFEDYLSSDNWLFIEWPEQIIDVLPSNSNRIDIKFETETSRSLKLTIIKEVLTEKLAMAHK